MTNTQFIEFVAKEAKADWLGRKIMLPSVVIAQAILESNWGKSELATKANALFGIKKNGWTGKVYIKEATEQNKDGSYITIANTEWRAYDSWEQSIIDHNDYIATREKSAGVLRYAAIIGNTDYKAVCNLLQECGYATSLTYATQLINIIDNYNLTQYDKESVTMFKIAIDAGHGLNTAGKQCLKSLDKNQTSEWWLNDRIADKLAKLLTSYNCETKRVDDITGATDVSLAKRVQVANDWGADVYMAIHHNAGLNGKKGGGIIVYYYSSKAERATQAQAMYNAVIKQTGLVGNRYTKVAKRGLYVLVNTVMPAFFLENGFMDSMDDTPIILTEEHADKTAQGLFDFLEDMLGLVKLSTATKPATKPATSNTASGSAATSKSFMVQILVDALNIRKGPSSSYAVDGCIRDRGIYTIVETSGNWGRLKSGAGWICISSKYAKKL